MKKNFRTIIIILVVIIYNFVIKAGPFDTQMTTLIQPNDITFTGRMWGDEFIFWAETEAGYRFVKWFDGWYYYATLNEQGEFAPTIYKVGIDSPPAQSFQLERSQERMDEILLRIQEFGEAVESANDWYAQKQAEAQGEPVNLTVGIILIEFPDFPRFSDPAYRPNGYLKTDFENMMFSENYWVGQQGNQIHPEEEEIFGSFREYWLQMSKGNLRITGEVVNPADENGVIEWLPANYNRVDYMYNLPYNTLADEAINKAVLEHWISLNQGDPNYYDKLVIVFAQNSIKFTNQTFRTVLILLA